MLYFSVSRRKHFNDVLIFRHGLQTKKKKKKKKKKKGNKMLRECQLVKSKDKLPPPGLYTTAHSLSLCREGQAALRLRPRVSFISFFFFFPP
jgi:hypothetical protein